MKACTPLLPTSSVVVAPLYGPVLCRNAVGCRQEVRQLPLFRTEAKDFVGIQKVEKRGGSAVLQTLFPLIVGTTQPLTSEQSSFVLFHPRSSHIYHTTMPFIILKKTRKATGTGFSASEKAFSFHGAAVTRTIKEAVNERLASMHRMETANALEFTWDEHIGQYIATMNHDFQKVRKNLLARAVADSDSTQSSEELPTERFLFYQHTSTDPFLYLLLSTVSRRRRACCNPRGYGIFGIQVPI